MPKSTDLSDNFSTLSYSYKGSKLPSWLYDPETKGILGKPKGDWIKLLVFYFFFFVFLALFWSFMMSVFIYFIIPTNNPMRTGTHNLLNLKPGLGIRPQIDHETVFIRFSPKDPQTYNGYVQHLDAFLDQYHHLEHNKNKLKCKDGKGETINDICHYPIEKLGPCSKDYGFADKKPCVLIKMNKIYGWIPELIDDSLKHSMLTCKGSNPLDSDNIGELQYYPSIQNGSLTYGYFDSSFYPYLGQPSYVAPIVAVKFESLKPNVIVHVTCELSNMPSYKDDLASQIRFEIAMDDYAVKSE